jgi:hypothetical protein
MDCVGNRSASSVLKHFTVPRGVSLIYAHAPSPSMLRLVLAN